MQSPSGHGLGAVSIGSTPALLRVYDAHARAARRTAPATARPRVHRVAQLEAHALDTHVATMLEEQLARCFAFTRWQPLKTHATEVRALLRALVLLGSTLSQSGATLGQRLQNLVLRRGEGVTRDTTVAPSTARLVAYVATLIGAPLLWHRVSARWAAAEAGTVKHRLWHWMRRCERGVQVLSLINFILFLWNGRYPNLVARVLGLRLVYANPKLARGVSFEFMNRQLVWHGLTEFLVVVLPLIDVVKIKAWFTRLSGAPPVLVPPGQCTLCHVEPMLRPHATDCGHTFCYYCIAAHCQSDTSFPCPACGNVVKRVQDATVVAQDSSDESD